MNTAAETTVNAIITPNELYKHWQEHRQLTRRVIDAFPEKELFEFSIGGMRTFAELSKELLSMAAPTLTQVITGKIVDFSSDLKDLTSKDAILKRWDESTKEMDIYWPQIPVEKFRETFNLYGQYNHPLIQNLQYIIDNEIHHRGQGYVYLRALNIAPPPFWEREPFAKYQG